VLVRIGILTYELDFGGAVIHIKRFVKLGIKGGVIKRRGGSSLDSFVDSPAKLPVESRRF